MNSYIALDIGEKRIGVAVADVSAPFASPLVTMEASENLPAEFAQLIKKHKASAIIIGYPRNQKGEPTEQTKRVEYIVSLLNIPQTLPIFWQDESLTSVKAEAELKKRKKHYTKGEVDALAATYILEDFIQTHPKGLPDTETVHTKNKTEKKQPRGLKRFLRLRWLVLVAALIVVLGIAATSLWYVQALSPRTADDVYSMITIEQGSGTKQIASQLAEKNVIKSAQAFTLYIRINGINTLQAGEYRLSSKQSVQEIAQIIESGRVTTVNVLIAPGLRLDQIITVLEKEGYDKDDIETALEDSRDHPILQGLPTDVKLEGYLYPDTYKIQPNTTVKQLISQMFDNFQRQVSSDIRAGIAKQGLNFRQAVILASIIQKEVPEPEVQRTVAQVFIKRLKEGKALGSDVTYIYSAALSGQQASPSLESPYNTRKYTGLPPTAISNFNLSALQAVANPTDTDYEFFVAGDDGTTHFSRTLEGHDKNIELYCTKLCN